MLQPLLSSSGLRLPQKSCSPANSAYHVRPHGPGGISTGRAAALQPLPLAANSAIGFLPAGARCCCWSHLGHLPRPGWGTGRRGSVAPRGRANSGSSSRASASASGWDEAGRMQQLQGQVFELKQRLVEAEVKRQAAEKAAAESQRVRQQLQRSLTQARWLLVAVVAVLLLAVGALAWAELEAPPLGTMTLGPNDALPGLTTLSAAVRRAAAWVQALAGSLWRKGVTF